MIRAVLCASAALAAGHVVYRTHRTTPPGHHHREKVGSKDHHYHHSHNSPARHVDLHAVTHGARSPPSLSAKPFALSDYQLTPGSRFAIQQQRNLEYLVAFNLTDLACQYTSAANLTGTYTAPTCHFMEFVGYSGHYVGHYLSATAMLYNNTQDPRVKAAGDTMVATLSRVQDAWTNYSDTTRGFVFSGNTVSFDNLFGSARNCAPICVPFYIYHKVMMGMLDQYTLAGSAQAFKVMMGMVDWAIGRINNVLTTAGIDQWQAVLNTEWGGMNDVLFNIYALTGNVTIFNAAMAFNHWAWTGPFIDGIDGLPGNHANTHIPEVIGDARGWELTGNTTKSMIVSNFFYFLNTSHSWATGGSNDHEHWGDANRMGDQLDDQTEESCTQYNNLKLARKTFTWSAAADGDTRWADYYERALYNGLIGNQALTGTYNTNNATGFIYMLPLGGGGVVKPWGASNEGLPCCWGTLSESFSKLGDSVMFTSMADDTLYVNLYVPITVTWQARGGAVIQQVTNYPYENGHTTTVRILNAGSGGTFTVALRVPVWADISASSVTVNGAPVTSIVAGRYLNLTSAWTAGDAITAWFQPTLRWEPLNDNRTDLWGGYAALMYGNILLAGVNTTTDQLVINTSLPLAGQISFNPDAPAGTLQFIAPTLAGVCDGPDVDTVNVTFIPLADVTFEMYTVYWNTFNVTNSYIRYNGSDVSAVPAALSKDLNVSNSGGASVLTNFADLNIRTGDPGETTVVYSTYTIQDPTAHPIVGSNFTFRYVSGYGPAGAPGGTNFSVLLVDGCSFDVSNPLAVLYASPVLSDYPFDVCNDCYSPPVVSVLPPGSISVPATSHNGVRVAFVFQNNARNLQLDLPLQVDLFWGSNATRTD